MGPGKNIIRRVYIRMGLVNLKHYNWGGGGAWKEGNPVLLLGLFKAGVYHK